MRASGRPGRRRRVLAIRRRAASRSSRRPTMCGPSALPNALRAHRRGLRPLPSQAAAARGRRSPTPAYVLALAEGAVRLGRGFRRPAADGRQGRRHAEGCRQRDRHAPASTTARRAAASRARRARRCCCASSPARSTSALRGLLTGSDIPLVLAAEPAARPRSTGRSTPIPIWLRRRIDGSPVALTDAPARRPGARRARRPLPG